MNSLEIQIERKKNWKTKLSNHSNFFFFKYSSRIEHDKRDKWKEKKEEEKRKVIWSISGWMITKKVKFQTIFFLANRKYQLFGYSDTYFIFVVNLIEFQGLIRHPNNQKYCFKRTYTYVLVCIWRMNKIHVHF